jgi:DNA-binding SARP family transcriptional activator
MESEIKITTLGNLSVANNAEIMEGFISTKAILLLVYLAMHPGDHARKKLAAMLWSETTNQQALKNLRTVLSSVRQAIPEVLVVSRDALAINPVLRVDVDAALFESGCRAMLSSSVSANQIATIQNLIELYQGAFLADVRIRDAAELTEWINTKQRQLHDQYLNLLHYLVDLTIKQADYEVGLAYARQLVGIDPLWENAQRQLMCLLVYTNRTHEALIQYESLVNLLDEELATEPEAETSTLYQQIKSQQLKPIQHSRRSTIVLPDTPFVETMDDLAMAQRMLNTPQCRLLTLYGISGVGKTALATQIAFHRQHLYTHGAHLISLKEIQSVRDLPYVIAATLGLEYSSQMEQGALEDMVVEALSDHHMLLVLDNYEHLLPETAFIETFLKQAPRLQLIITSQTPLNLFREWLIPLSGLPIPPPDAVSPQDYASVRLFDLIARRINPRFNLNEHLAGIIKICELVDGLPLAIIIAAGWTQIAPVNKIVDSIVEGQEFNLPFQQDLPPRHRSLEMMLEYTWSTPSDDEQYALTSLSIFNASFDMDETQAICGIEISLLTNMIQRSLVQRYDDRYRMHNLIWRYARRKLLYSDYRQLLAERYLKHIARSLSALRTGESLLLHEYLLTVEIQYSRIWNFDWMPKRHQPRYVLEISQFLMPYWEISRAEALATVTSLIKEIDTATLEPEMVMIWHVQMAQLHAVNSDTHHVKDHLQQALTHNTIQATWHHIAVIFSLYHNMSHLLTASPNDQETINEDVQILRRAQFKLTTLYMQLREYDEVDAMFAHLFEEMQNPINCAYILALRGAIAAETRGYATAYTHFSDALQRLKDIDEPMLFMHLTVFLMRVSFAQNQLSDTCKYLVRGLKLAIQLNAQVTLRELVLFHDTLPQRAAVTVSGASLHELDGSEDVLYTLADQIIQQADSCEDPAATER